MRSESRGQAYLHYAEPRGGKDPKGGLIVNYQLSIKYEIFTPFRKIFGFTTRYVCGCSMADVHIGSFDALAA